MTKQKNPKYFTFAFLGVVVLVLAVLFVLTRPNTESTSKVSDKQETSEQSTSDNVEVKTSLSSIALNLYTTPNKNEVEVVLKNTSNENIVYNDIPENFYKFKILSNTGTVVSEGDFGYLMVDKVEVPSNGEFKVTFNYGNYVESLPQGNYTLEVTSHHKDLQGLKAGITFVKGDFNGSVKGVGKGNVVLRSLDVSNLTAEGVINGVKAVTFHFDSSLVEDLKGVELNKDILKVTYEEENGTYTLVQFTIDNK